MTDKTAKSTKAKNKIRQRGTGYAILVCRF